MPKWMRVLIGVCVASIGAFLVSQIPPSRPTPAVPAAPRDIVKLEVRVADPAFHVVVEKTEGGWVLREPLAFPADPSVVDAFTSGLAGLTVGPIVTRRAETHAVYQVDEARGVSVRAWSGGASAPLEWVFGKASPDGGRVYLRRPGEAEVYLATGLDRSTLETSLTAWRDRRILPLGGLEDVTGLAQRRGGAVTSLRRSSASWTRDGAAVDGEAVNRYVQTLRGTQAEDFLDAPDAATLRSLGLENPEETLTVVLASGKTHELRFGKSKKGDTRVPVQRADSPTVYWLPSWARDQLPLGGIGPATPPPSIPPPN